MSAAEHELLGKQRAIKRLGRYSVRNVNKREKRLTTTVCSLQKTCDNFEEDKADSHARIQALQIHTEHIRKKLQDSEKGRQNCKSKLISAQKTMSKLRKQKTMSIVMDNYNSDCTESETTVEPEAPALGTPADEEEGDNSKFITREEDGKIFLPHVRECVVELLGLEVSTKNVAPVIQSVLKHMAKIEVPLSDLPKKQTVVNISDSAQYLLRHMYTDKIEQSTNVGIKKDGTKKQGTKIMTSTITLDTGEDLHLGFQLVARETGASIAERIKDQLKELQDVCHKESDGEGNSTNTFLTEIMKKLSYFMSDRAANEGKADDILREWRDSVLAETGNAEEKTTVHSLHCLAHVLLGFVYHGNKEFKKQHDELAVSDIKLGREKSSVYARYQFDFAPIRVTRMASEVLGPMPDEKSGVHNKWHAHLRVLGKKSLIQHFKDNRFNATYECAAAVLHHHSDIISLMDKLESLNLKIRSVKEDLEDSRVHSMVHAFALVYVKLTGPFWDLCVSKSVQYLDLFKYVQLMADALKHWVDDPMKMLTETEPVFPDFSHDTTGPFWNAAVAPPADEGFFRRTLQSILKGMQNCVNLQLSSFLPGGKYGCLQEEKEVQRTKGSGLNNLSSERCFGSLDASMSKRRHASLHYHSSMNMLKTSRGRFQNWLASKGEMERGNLWKHAGRNGRKMRERHRQEERNQLQTEERELQEESARKQQKLMKKATQQVSAKKTSKSKAKKTKPRHSRSASATATEIPARNIAEPQLSDWVAVGYDNGWYPGYITALQSDSCVEVKFMHPTSISGHYKFPDPEDIAAVDIPFIFACPIDSPLLNSSGRVYILQTAMALQQDYLAFKLRCLFDSPSLV